MTTNEIFGRDLSHWLHEEGEHRVPDHLADVLWRPWRRDSGRGGRPGRVGLAPSRIRPADRRGLLVAGSSRSGGRARESGRSPRCSATAVGAYQVPVVSADGAIRSLHDDRARPTRSRPVRDGMARGPRLLAGDLVFRRRPGRRPATSWRTPADRWHLGLFDRRPGRHDSSGRRAAARPAVRDPRRRALAIGRSRAGLPLGPPGYRSPDRRLCGPRPTARASALIVEPTAPAPIAVDVVARWDEGRLLDQRHRPGPIACRRSRRGDRHGDRVRRERGRPSAGLVVRQLPARLRAPQRRLLSAGRRSGRRVAMWSRSVPTQPDKVGGSHAQFSPDGTKVLAFYDSDRLVVGARSGRWIRGPSWRRDPLAIDLAVHRTLIPSRLHARRPAPSSDGRPSRSCAVRRGSRLHDYNRGHGPPSHPDPRRRHRSGAGGGNPSRARRIRRRLRVGDRGRRRGRHRPVRHAAPGSRPGVHQAQQGRAQGPHHDAGRRGASGASTSRSARRSACTPTCARPGRSRASRRATRTSTSSSSARTPRTCTPASSTWSAAMPRRASRSSPARRRSGSPGSPSSTRSRTAATRSRPSTRPTS